MGPGPAGQPHLSNAVRSNLRGDQDAVAVSDDLAARDLRLVGDHLLELLVANPAGDDLRRLLALLRRLEEAERAEYAVVGLDQVVPGEPGELLQLRDEHLVDLAGQVGRAVLVHTVVTTNDRKHVVLLLYYRTGSPNELSAALRSVVTIEEGRTSPRRRQRRLTR